VDLSSKVNDEVLLRANQFGTECKRRSYSHGTAAAMYDMWALWIGIAGAVFGTAASISIFRQPDSVGIHGTDAVKVFAASLAGIAAFLTSLLTFFKPSELAAKHVVASGAYETLQSRALNVLLEVSDPGVDASATRKVMEDLHLEIGKLKANSPILSESRLQKYDRRAQQLRTSGKSEQRQEFSSSPVRSGPG
jgi:hypothetical protein